MTPSQSDPSQAPLGQQNSLQSSTQISEKEKKTKGKRGKYLIEIERNKCISVGNCVAIAGDVFDFDEEQIAVMKDPDLPLTSDDETILMAARSCPTQAIIIKDSETGEQIFP